jgi:hypothetical protein
MKRVHVHIDRLVLKGLGNGSPEAIAQGLQQQLAAMLSAPGAIDAWNSSGHTPRLQVGPVVMTADASPAQVGQSLCDAIGKGVTR